MSQIRNYEFPILAINKEEYDAIQNWIDCHRTQILGKKLFIFGAGIRGNMILKLLEEAGINIEGFCDSSVEKQKAFVNKYKIFNPDQICDKPEENYIIISPENSFEIETMLREKGYIEEKNYFIIKNKIYQTYKNEFFRMADIDYILFGDCYFTDLDIDDLFSKSMGEIVTDKLGKEKTKVLSMHGMCIPSFYYLMKMQIELGIIPKVVAFIVNIPFCNGIQTKLPQSQHVGLLKSIRDEMPIHNDEFDEYVKLAENRSHNINSNSFSTRKNTLNRDDNYVEKLLTKARYMYEFKEDNENIIYLKKMIELLRENGIKPLPFIPALNYYTGIKFFGYDFTNQYNKICRNIQECLKEYNIDILNMSYILEKDCYSGERMTKFPNITGKEKEITLLCNKIVNLLER